MDYKSKTTRTTYLEKATKILEKLNIQVRDINTKLDIENASNIVATLTPTLEKIKIK